MEHFPAINQQHCRSGRSLVDRQNITVPNVHGYNLLLNSPIQIKTALQPANNQAVFPMPNLFPLLSIDFTLLLPLSYSTVHFMSRALHKTKEEIYPLPQWF